MREIKFRALDLDGNWRYGYFWKGNINSYIKDFDGCDWKIDISTLGQSTGFKDKNGKEIFEGDIISAGLHGKTWVVKDIRIDTLRLARMIKFRKEHKTKDYFIIIGNKFENPELLKGGGS